MYVSHRFQMNVWRTVFLASDRASVNTGVINSQISLIRKGTPWFSWCFAHHKDAIKEWMELITICLQNLYYLYETSSKMLRELKNLHTILKNVYEFENDQVKSHRATDTCWIAHKLIALKNMLDKLYMQHFENIIADMKKIKQTKPP